MSREKGKDKLGDVIDNNTQILFCGMSPGQKTCDMGHYYADPSNRFWKLMHKAKLLDSEIEPTPNSEKRKFNYNKLRVKKIGLTDLVKNQCGMDRDIVLDENNLIEIYIKRLEVLITVNKNIKCLIFNGKTPAVKFFKKNKRDIKFDYQEEESEKFGLNIYVLPSTSGVNARYSLDKLCIYLSKFISHGFKL